MSRQLILRSFRKPRMPDWREDALIDAGLILDVIGDDDLAVRDDGEMSVHRTRGAFATHYCVDIFDSKTFESMTVFEAAIDNDGRTPPTYIRARRGLWTEHLAQWAARVRAANRNRRPVTLLPRFDEQADGAA